MWGRELTFGDREEISRGLAAGLSYNEIASRLGRHRSVVSREVGRNGGGGRYRAAEAQQRAEVKRRRPKVSKLAADRRLREAVARRLAADYSPQQVSQRLRKDFPHDAEMRVSHETIYQTLCSCRRAAS